MKIKVKLADDAIMPTKSHHNDAGFDLYVPMGMHFKVGIRRTATIFTGVHMDIPEGYYGEVCNRSGLNFKNGTTLHGSGTIDSGYTGSIGVKIYNDSDSELALQGGDRIAQIIIHKIPDVELVEVNELSETERGSNGFGSTGR